ncbi:MAG TPA: OsmC family protein [Acidimicrobiia bacterium]|nr:OsmC family protein [Acidimicrobiia bacterium]
MTSEPATGADRSVGTKTHAAQNYRVHGMSRPGGHGKIRCNTTDIKADTGSISDEFRPGPAELLCAALAACLLKNVERYSEILPFRCEQASVVVEAERRDAPPTMTRMHYTLELVTDEPPHRVELLHRNVRKFGTVTNTLAAALDLTGEVVARNHHEEPERHDQSAPTDTIPGDASIPPPRSE